VFARLLDPLRRTAECSRVAAAVAATEPTVAVGGDDLEDVSAVFARLLDPLRRTAGVTGV
jgi:hypothetical protein